MLFDQFTKGRTAQEGDVTRRAGRLFRPFRPEFSLSLLQGVSRAELWILHRVPILGYCPQNTRTCSPAWPIITVIVSGATACAVRITWSSKASPPTRWRTLGSFDFIRVPCPAARITTCVKVCPVYRLLGSSKPSRQSTAAVLCTNRAYSLTLTRSSAENTSFRLRPVTEATPAMDPVWTRLADARPVPGISPRRPSRRRFPRLHLLDSTGPTTTVNSPRVYQTAIDFVVRPNKNGLFVNLGQLTSHNNWSYTKICPTLDKAGGDSVWSLEERKRVPDSSGILEPGFSVFRPSRGKSEHRHRNHGKSTGHHRSKWGRGTRNGLHPDPGLPARVHKLDPGIRDTRVSRHPTPGPGAGPRPASGEAAEPALEVVGVETDGRRGYPEVTQQLSRMPGILGRNEVRLAQNTQARSVTSSRLPIGVATTDRRPGIGRRPD